MTTEKVRKFDAFDSFKYVKDLLKQMLTKKQIGKIQLMLGIIFFIATIISSIGIIKEVYIGTLIKGVSSTTVAWSEVEQEINATAIGIKGLVTSNVIFQAEIIKTTMWLFGWISVALLVLSIILILQGLSNLTTKNG